MKVKDLDRDTTIKLIDLLKKRIEFNNVLNKYVRKFMKDRGLDSYTKFNGYHDAPTDEMRKEFDNIFDNNSLGDVSWMSDSLKAKYKASCAEIFGQVYSPAVNRYVLDDLHDCEKHLAEIEKAASAREEENDVFKVERDLATNRLNIFFDDIPEPEVRAILKRNGFRWSNYLGAWTRQLTDNAEKSLETIKRELQVK